MVICLLIIMSIEDRRRTAEEIIAYLRSKGYIKTSAEIDSRTGECRISMTTLS